MESAKRIAEMKALDDVKPVIAVGDKVRLKYDAITQSPDYDRRVENYKKFSECLLKKQVEESVRGVMLSKK